MFDAQERIPGRFYRPVLAPRTTLLLLVAACNLYLVHAVVLFLVVAPPYGRLETLLVWGTGFAGLALLSFGGVVGLAMLREIRSSEHAIEQSEAELRETRQQLHAVIDASPLAIIATAPDGRVQVWNRAATAILGWPEADVLGRSDPSIPEDCRGQHRELHARLLEGAAVTGLETRRRRRDDTTVDVSVSAAPLRDATGAVAGTIAVVADITQQKLAAAERDRLEQQLRHAMRMEAVGRLAGGVAHDFNNLLTAIRGHNELALERAVDGDVREELKQIGRASERASVLTRQLLAFSRQQRVETAVLSLNDVVLQLRKMLVRVIGEHIALETVLEPDLGPVLADAGQIEQVLMNLAVNARDAMPRGGELLVTTENATITEEEAARFTYDVKPGSYVALSVSDNGAGMEPETLALIFEPFYTTKPPGVGTGLGLAQAYGIVKQHNGYIWADSEPGAGSVFRIYLPRVNTTVASSATPTPNTFDAAVLVVDDEDAVRRLVRRVLERNGFGVLEAETGAAARAVVNDHAEMIDLVCCDVQLPDLPGSTVLASLREALPSVPILIMSGYDRDTIADDGMLDRAGGFLEKPFTPEALLIAVRRLLGKRAIRT